MLWRSFLPPCSGWYKKTTLKTEAESFCETIQLGIKIQKTVIIVSHVVQTSVHNFVWFFFLLAHLTLFGQLEESEDVMRTEVSTVFPKNNDNMDIAVAVRHNYWFCNRWHSDCWNTRSADILSLFWTYNIPTYFKCSIKSNSMACGIVWIVIILIVKRIGPILTLISTWWHVMMFA